MTGKRRNKKTASSADKLPQDLWPDILARLPVKTLLKFRCVCKSWRSIIDDPDFISMHLTLFNSNLEKPQILTLSMKRTLRTHWLNTYKKSGTIFQFPQGLFTKINGYANGLMLVSNKSELMLLNPSLRKFLKLPPCPIGDDYYSNNVFLGIDPSTDDLKVVVVLNCGLMRGYAAIFNLSKGTWQTKSIGGRNVDDYNDVNLWTYGRGVSWKGAVHFIPGHFSIVVSFDLVSETLNYRDLPLLSDRWRYKSLFVLRESLALFEYDSEGFCIWVMGNNDDWTKQFSWNWSLQSKMLISSEPPELFYVEKTDMLYISLSRELLTLHLKSDELEVLHKFRDSVLLMDTYVESLVLANDLQGQSFINIIRFIKV